MGNINASFAAPNEVAKLGLGARSMGAVAAQLSGDAGRIAAAADFLGNGAIEVNMYEKEIYDLVRRSSPTLQRFKSVPATGHPHRYFEETSIGTAIFTDPRTITTSATGPTRVERPAFIKALTAQTNLSLFDIDVNRQQGIFPQLEAQDINDIISAIQILRAQNIWNGNDTSLSSPTTIQYMGLLAQITQTAVIAPGASIIDGLKAQIALMVSNQTYAVRPTAIYMTPLLGDYIDREAKAAKIELGTDNVTAGVKVSFLQTQAGAIPMIPDVFLPTSSGAAFGFGAPPAGNKNYYAVILTESDVELPFVHGGDGNPNPRLFQLGLLAGLQGQYVGIKFDTVIAKGPSYAHSVVVVQRP